MSGLRRTPEEGNVVLSSSEATDIRKNDVHTLQRTLDYLFDICLDPYLSVSIKDQNIYTYIQLCIQSALPVATIMAELRHRMYGYTYIYIIYIYIYIYIYKYIYIIYI